MGQSAQQRASTSGNRDSGSVPPEIQERDLIYEILVRVEEIERRLAAIEVAKEA